MIVTKPAYWNNLTDSERIELDALVNQIQDRAKALSELRKAKRKLLDRAGARRHRRKE